MLLFHSAQLHGRVLQPRESPLLATKEFSDFVQHSELVILKRFSSARMRVLS